MKRRRRGFSLPETMTVMTVTGVMLGVAVPKFGAMMRSNQLEKHTRALAVAIKRTRTLAVSGMIIEEGPPLVRATVAGIRVDTPYRYSVFVDRDGDSTNFNELDVVTVDIPEGPIRIYKPEPGTQVRFEKNGSTTTTRFVIADPDKRQYRSIELTAGGQVRVQPVDETQSSATKQEEPPPDQTSGTNRPARPNGYP